MSDVRVVTLNLFNNGAGRWGDRAPLVIDQARQLDADVFTFQECDLGSGQVRAVADALGPAYSLVPLQNPTPGSRKSLAVVTRLEVDAVDHCVDLGATDAALRVRLRAGAATADVVTTHLHFGPAPRDREIRAVQVRRLLAWIGPTDRRATIVTGDFNGGAGGATVMAMKSGLRSAHEVVHGVEPAWTHPTPLLEIIDTRAAFGVPLLPDHLGHTIDYVFVSDVVAVRDCRVCFDRPSPDEPQLYPSDHVGVVADLEVP
jgi:endonuclease/exonuclease/phosphatase family metal-dependent hydrolase